MTIGQFAEESRLHACTLLYCGRIAASVMEASTW
jgi:hypothetical protein